MIHIKIDDQLDRWQEETDTLWQSGRIHDDTDMALPVPPVISVFSESEFDEHHLDIGVSDSMPLTTLPSPDDDPAISFDCHDDASLDDPDGQDDSEDTDFML